MVKVRIIAFLQMALVFFGVSFLYVQDLLSTDPPQVWTAVVVWIAMTYIIISIGLLMLKEWARKSLIIISIIFVVVSSIMLLMFLPYLFFYKFAPDTWSEQGFALAAVLTHPELAFPALVWNAWLCFFFTRPGTRALFLKNRDDS